MTGVSRTLPQLPLTSPYVAYAYSYPHKTAYRPLSPPRRLDRVWRDEPQDQLFLYLHVPFCEMRCGFCNLFTTANPRSDVVSDYLEALTRQATVVRRALGADMRVARMAIGGGTPTFLEAAELERLLHISSDLFGTTSAVPTSVETSPRTASRERLAVLKAFGVSRVSIGIQSFVETEVASSGRAQKNAWVESALGLIRDLDFATLNLDLIYGLPGQTVASWVQSLTTALEWRPEELYLYPLYVRPLTGLQRRGATAHDELRMACYQEAVSILTDAGYEQVSMRMFRKLGPADTDAAPHYCCQDDGMVGLGCGARSYTRRLHYSSEYAVGASGVKEIIADYNARSDKQFATIDYGCEVSDDEQQRRWLIKSLFRSAGLDRRTFGLLFGNDAIETFPDLAEMVDAGYFLVDERTIKPTATGLAWADALAPMLFSTDVQARSEEFELR